jgi:hypothetical protein
MASFVARITDMRALLDSWADLLKAAAGSFRSFKANERVFETLDEWPRIQWFYYCDDQNGNTIRLYDSKHFDHFGRDDYLEKDGREHKERVIMRGENMWGEGNALQDRFREESAWELFSARQAPLLPQIVPPQRLLQGQRVMKRPGGIRTIDIQRGMSLELRLWYFEHVNQESASDFPSRSVRPRLLVTSATMIEALRRLPLRADGPRQAMRPAPPEDSDSAVTPSEKIGLDESEWRDDASSLADWEAWIRTIEPLEFTPEEAARIAEFDVQMRQYNVEAVRRQMQEGPCG